NAFFEDSTRTRTSFELAAQRLSADIINFSSKGSSVAKGETLVDTARNIEAMGVDVIVIRHSAAGAAELLSRAVQCSVVNAGDGAHEHPTQGLLDVYTIRERFGKVEGLKIAIVGDIANSRVARSNLWALTKLGAKARRKREGRKRDGIMDVFEFRERGNSGVDQETERLAQQVIGAAIEVHRLIKPGMPENVYKRALSRELTLLRIPHECEVCFPV